MSVSYYEIDESRLHWTVYLDVYVSFMIIH